jgi:hypothetical protein
MSSLATIIKDDSLASTLRFGIFGLAACSVVGVAAYIGYRAAGPNKALPLHNRNPESNEQVKFQDFRANFIRISYSFFLHIRMTQKFHDAIQRHDY